MKKYPILMDIVECRFGKDLFKIKLRKLYLSFSEEHRQYSRLLETLSLYCQFFLDDERITENYKSKMARLQFYSL